jgi:hypothetical protein
MSLHDMLVLQMPPCVQMESFDNSQLAYRSIKISSYPSMYLKVDLMSLFDQIGLLMMEMKIKIFNNSCLAISIIGRRACKSYRPSSD